MRCERKNKENLFRADTLAGMKGRVRRKMSLWWTRTLGTSPSKRSVRFRQPGVIYSGQAAESSAEQPRLRPGWYGGRRRCCLWRSRRNRLLNRCFWMLVSRNVRSNNGCWRISISISISMSISIALASAYISIALALTLA